MSIQRLHVAKRYSEVVIHNGTIYLAGQLADEFDGDIHEQTRQTLANIDKMLAEAGSDKSKILRAQIYLPNLSDFPRMNEVWEKWVVPGHTPTRATVQAALANPKWKIEVVITAAV